MTVVRKQPYDTEKKLGELLIKMIYATLKAEDAAKKVRKIKSEIASLGFNVELDPNLRLEPNDLIPPRTPLDET